MFFFKLLELEFNIFDKSPDSHLQNIRQVEDAVAQEYSNPACRQYIVKKFYTKVFIWKFA